MGGFGDESGTGVGGRPVMDRCDTGGEDDRGAGCGGGSEFTEVTYAGDLGLEGG